MASAKKVHRYKAGETGSSFTVEEKKVSAEEKQKEEVKIASEREKNANPGFFLKAAVWILSRFPWTKHRYQNWTSGRRILIGWLLWIICLPIIPLVAIIIWYVNDPDGFKKSPWAKGLIALFVVWAGAFGLIATEPAQLDINGKYSPIQTQPDGEKAVDANGKALPEKLEANATQEARDKIANQKESNATNGQKFENCTQAFEAGVFNIKRSDASYQNKLDRDNDGIACER
jgi:hypothetical protein